MNTKPKNHCCFDHADNTAEVSEVIPEEAWADNSATKDEKVAENSTTVATTWQNKETEEPSALYEVSDELAIDEELESNGVIGAAPSLLCCAKSAVIKLECVQRMLSMTKITMFKNTTLKLSAKFSTQVFFTLM